jgi:hypothetical protein
MRTDRQRFKRSDMVELLPGLKKGVNDIGCEILEIHYSADPRKTRKWAAQEAATYIGGFAGFSWMQEQEISFTAVRGEAVFPMWEPAVHLVEHSPKEAHAFRLSMDFGIGNPTVALLNGVLPDGAMHVYGEHWMTDATVSQNKEGIYAMLESVFGGFGNINEKIQSAVGDPTGKALMMEYAQEPMPIYIVGSLGRKDDKRLNDKRAGFSKIRSMFYSRFSCCGKYFYGHFSHCPVCNKEVHSRPFLTISPRCQHLIEEIPRQVWPEPSKDQFQMEDNKLQKIPHDTIDALRYGVMAHIEWKDKPEEEDREPLRGISGFRWPKPDRTNRSYFEQEPSDAVA